MLDKTEGGISDNEMVDFDGPEDSQNPLNWSLKSKWGIVFLISTMTFITSFATVILAPAAPQILAEFQTSSSYITIFLVSIWELGEAFAPLFTAPLSEIFGRAPAYHAANIVFIVASICCGLSTNVWMLVAFRFINGMSVAAIVLNPSIVGDMFREDERGAAISVEILPSLVAPVLGPVIGGYLTEAKGWRWACWLSAILAGVCEMAFVVWFREPYKVVILQKKAARMRKETGNQALRCFYDSHTAEIPSRLSLLKLAIVRPPLMIYQSQMLLLLAVYYAVSYGYIFLISTTITTVFENTYGFSQGAAGLTFLGLGVGMIIGTALCAISLDWYLKKMSLSHGGEIKPEYRLPPMILGGVAMPAGLFLYGWSIEFQLHWIVPILGSGLVGFGIMVTLLPSSNYLVDAFKTHAASGMAAVLVLSGIAGAVVPLAAPPLYSDLGYGWGNSVLGFIALAFVPVPMLFIKFGERIRKMSKYEVVS